MILDHIAYRVVDRYITAKFFSESMGYKIQDEFTINFDNGETAKCFALSPLQEGLHEIFISDGSPDSIVGKWVSSRGGGIHHLAYRVDNVEEKMNEWIYLGVAEFTTEKPLVCPGLIQCFTKEHPLTGVVYELISRENKGFCADNVKDLMVSSDVRR